MAEALKSWRHATLYYRLYRQKLPGQEQLLEIKECLGAVEKVHNILVMSAATRRADVKLILENYQLIGYDSVILTKLDEDHVLRKYSEYKSLYG